METLVMKNQKMTTYAKNFEFNLFKRFLCNVKEPNLFISTRFLIGSTYSINLKLGIMINIKYFEG